MESNTIRVSLFNCKSYLDIYGQNCYEGKALTSQHGVNKIQSRQHGSCFVFIFHLQYTPTRLSNVLFTDTYP